VNATALDRVETARMVCERLRPDHLAELERLLRDPRVSRWVSATPDPPTKRQVASGLAAKVEHWERYGFGLWLLRDLATGEMVGRGGLQHTFVAETHEVEVGWAIVPERWGEGLGTELAQVSLDVAFDQLHLLQVVAFTLPDNVASRRVMEKGGFRYEREIEHVGLPHVLYSARARDREAPHA
jgi:[ribosomal protein S5]-alanine N-acetyltransferase